MGFPFLSEDELDLFNWPLSAKTMAPSEPMAFDVPEAGVNFEFPPLLGSPESAPFDPAPLPASAASSAMAPDIFNPGRQNRMAEIDRELAEIAKLQSGRLEKATTRPRMTGDQALVTAIASALPLILGRAFAGNRGGALGGEVGVGIAKGAEAGYDEIAKEEQAKNLKLYQDAEVERKDLIGQNRELQRADFNDQSALRLTKVKDDYADGNADEQFERQKQLKGMPTYRDLHPEVKEGDKPWSPEVVKAVGDELEKRGFSRILANNQDAAKLALSSQRVATGQDGIDVRREGIAARVDEGQKNRDFRAGESELARAHREKIVNMTQEQINARAANDISFKREHDAYLRESQAIQREDNQQFQSGENTLNRNLSRERDAYARDSRAIDREDQQTFVAGQDEKKMAAAKERAEIMAELKKRLPPAQLDQVANAEAFLSQIEGFKSEVPKLGEASVERWGRGLLDSNSPIYRFKARMNIKAKEAAAAVEGGRLSNQDFEILQSAMQVQPLDTPATIIQRIDDAAERVRQNHKALLGTFGRAGYNTRPFDMGSKPGENGGDQAARDRAEIEEIKARMRASRQR